MAMPSAAAPTGSCGVPTRLTVRALAGGAARLNVHLDPGSIRLRLAHRQAADGIALETDGLQLVERRVAQRLVHPSLHDAEQHPGVRIARAARPAHGELHRLFRLLF